jgi:hypothetical protein
MLNALKSLLLPPLHFAEKTNMAYASMPSTINTGERNQRGKRKDQQCDKKKTKPYEILKE